MRPLRLMTFNVQLLPVIAGVLEGTVSVPAGIAGLLPGGASDSIATAEAVAADLLRIPPDERPDVMAFNEVFSEDARAVLLNELRSDWPHVVESVHQGDLEEDAGLMVFSRLPFHTLPNGEESWSRFYGDDAGADTWASKAAVLVQVPAPAEITTLVFTHLQAAYDTEEQYRDVRKSQVSEIRELVADVLGNDPVVWNNVIVAGDLNIRGDADATSDEWYDVFDDPNDPFGAIFADSWTEMRPPRVHEDLDPGLTHRSRETQVEQRLDYICRLKTDDGVDLLAHQMRIGHRDTSDHYALEALIQRRDDHCQPSLAVDLDALSPMAGSPDPSQARTSTAWAVQPTIKVEGGRSWIWLPRPGTFTFHTSVDLLLDVYAAHDISRPLERYDSLSVTQVPAAVQPAYQEFGRGIDDEGSTFVNRHPMLVCARTRDGEPGGGFVMVLEHLGDTMETAIALPPHQDVTVPFPPHQRLGDDDRAWFRIQPRATLMGAAREESVAYSLTGGSGALDVFDAGMTSLGSTSGSQPTLTHTFTAQGDDELYITLQRGSDDETDQQIRWSTPVSYLRLDKGFTVHVANESGFDWPGEDEPELEMWMDGDKLLSTSWDDADTGEDWPGFVDKVWFEVVTRGWTSKSVGFTTSLDFTIEDPDDLGAAHGVNTWTIAGLSAHEPPERKRTMAVTVLDTISDGTYTVTCTLTRDP